jgi:hypothetical protein
MKELGSSLLPIDQHDDLSDLAPLGHHNVHGIHTRLTRCRNVIDYGYDSTLRYQGSAIIGVGLCYALLQSMVLAVRSDYKTWHRFVLHGTYEGNCGNDRIGPQLLAADCLDALPSQTVEQQVPGKDRPFWGERCQLSMEEIVAPET